MIKFRFYCITTGCKFCRKSGCTGLPRNSINAANNFSNGTIATLSFDVDEDFCGTTEVKVVVKEAIRYDEKRKTFVMVTNLQSGIVSVTRPKLAIKV